MSSWGLARRLVAGTLAVALASIVMLVVVTLVVTNADLANAGREKERTTTNELVATVGAAYQPAGGWDPATLAAVGQLARTTGFGIQVRSVGHSVLEVAASQAQGQSRTLPVVVAGRQIATATIQFPASGLSLEEISLRHTISTTVASASILAALVALAAAVLISRRIVAPIRSLTRAARRLGTGDLKSRVGNITAPGEIKELANAFDAMAAHLEREDTLRRVIVADLAHELRTPVAVLQAELEAITVGLEELSPTAVRSLSEEVHRLGRLVEDLEVLASAEAATLTLLPVTVDLADVACSAATRLSASFAERGLELSTDAIPTAVIGDPDRLEQIVVNLLSNAAKFTPFGGRVRLTVDQHGAVGRLAVADTGLGIPPGEQAMVFERFFRGQGAAGTGGSGVGLAVVTELVAAHGGHVELKSAPGKGTTVTVCIPLSRL